MKYLKLLSIGLLINCNSVFAQIIYTDIIPDTTIIAADDSWGTFSVDINQDSTEDYLLNHHNMLISMNYQKIEIGASHINAEILCDTSAGNYPLSLPFGQSINSSIINWYYPVGWMVHLNENGTSGNWIGVTDQYLAVRIKLNGQWHYGWIRLDIPTNAGSYTVKDFAYESIPDKAITAGDNGQTVIEDISIKPEIIIFPNPSNGKFNIKSDCNINFIEIYNSHGEKIYSTSIKKQAINEIDISDSSKGIYFLKIYDGVNVYIEKIMK